LNMTSASSFQMLRGSVIIFTGLLSVAFLGRKLELSQWLGILVTIVGLVVVGLADLRSSHDQKHKLSEVITALASGNSTRCDIFCTIARLSQVSGTPRRTREDALDAFCQIGHRPLIALALLANISSIAFFNFAGISVTKEISATTRMVLDSLRTLVIWAVSLAVGWETFHGLEILGFGVLLTGTALYNGLHRSLLALLPRRAEE
ncbi:PREDICTED: solute carrier family 35 member F6, partial [Charadrius vociferus]|uniref:solute carrier family 35 member F6 n=1 Tax=Charadrius vociferus TaxID=50402 RepID=UPI0005213D21